MIHKYEWDPGLEHDWLGVDNEGRVGYFMSAYYTMLPTHISIPWPYLHKLASTWLAYCSKCSCLEMDDIVHKMSWRKFVEMIAHTGLYVWDATMDIPDGCFRLLCSPPKPLRVDEIHPFFALIAKSFVSEAETFHNVELIGKHFSDGKSAFGTGYTCVNRLPSDFLSHVDEKLKRLQDGNASNEHIVLPDMCCLSGAPCFVGPTFSCWDEVKFCYSELIITIASRLGSSRIETKDFYGRVNVVDTNDFREYALKQSLPFLAVSLPCGKTQGIGICLNVDDARGSLILDCDLGLEGITKERGNIHLEDWDFNICVNRNNSNKRTFKSVAKRLIVFSERVLKRV